MRENGGEDNKFKLKKDKGDLNLKPHLVGGNDPRLWLGQMVRTTPHLPSRKMRVDLKFKNTFSWWKPPSAIMMVNGRDDPYFTLKKDDGGLKIKNIIGLVVVTLGYNVSEW